MIHKKMLCSFVFMSFLLSSGNIVAMGKGKPVVAKGQVLLDAAIDPLMPKFIDANFALTLGGDTMIKSMQDQWERFITFRQKEIDFNNPENVLSPLYADFSKEIMNHENNKLFKHFLQNENVTNKPLLLMSLNVFLNEEQVRKEFLALGVQIVKNMQPVSDNSDTLPGSKLPTPPLAPTLVPKANPQSVLDMTEDEAVNKAVKVLTSSDLNPNSPQAVLAASEFFELDEDQIMTRAKIERIADEKLKEIQNDFEKQPKKQEKLAEAVENARGILKHQIDNPSIPTPPLAPILVPKEKLQGDLGMTEDAAVKVLTSSDLNPNSAKAVDAANKVLDLKMNEQLSRFEIEAAYQREMADIRNNLVDQPVEQAILVNAATAAKNILEYKLDHPSDNPNVLLGVSEAFRQRVANDANLIAQILLSDNISEVTSNNIMTALKKANIMIWGLNENPIKMAYLMGYVQNCVWNLPSKSSSKKISDDQVQVISRVAEVLNIINSKQARTA